MTDHYFTLLPTKNEQYFNLHSSTTPGLAAHKRDIFQACENGDVNALDSLLSSLGVTPGDKQVIIESASGPPATTAMIEAAVANRQPRIIEYLAAIYRDIDFSHTSSVADALLSMPDMETLLALYTVWPGLVNFSFNSQSSILCQSCERCGKTNPEILFFLLDHGSDPNEGFRGAIHSALAHNVSLRVIKKMMEKGAVVTIPHLEYAIWRGRKDVLKFWIYENGIDIRILERQRDVQNLLDKADMTEDRDMIKLSKIAARRWMNMYESEIMPLAPPPVELSRTKSLKQKLGFTQIPDSRGHPLPTDLGRKKSLRQKLGF